MRPPFFIVGCVRSGTTLLRNLLRNHPNLWCPEETQYYRWGDPFGMPGFMNQVGKSSLMKKHRQIDGVDEGWFQRELPLARSRKDLLERFANEFLRVKGAPGGRWFDKSPQNVYGIPLLRHDFPDAKFVHIVRNPLNVIASLLIGKVIAAPSLVAAANYWQEAVAIVSTCKPMLGDALYEFRYEDLVADARGETSKLVEFLGEDPSLLEFTHNVHGEKDQHRATLTDADRKTLVEICGDWAKFYGYDLEVQTSHETVGEDSGVAQA